MPQTEYKPRHSPEYAYHLILFWKFDTTQLTITTTNNISKMSKTQQAKGQRKIQLARTKKMTKKEERQAIRKTKLLFRRMTRLLCPALRLFFLRKLGRKSVACDAQKLLYQLRGYNRRQGSNSQLLRDGKSVTAVRKIIKYAIRGRNNVCHSNLPEIRPIQNHS